MFLKAIISFNCIVVILADPRYNETLLKGIYWEVKPFIFTNNNGELDGIIPKIFERAHHYCMPNKSLITFAHRLKSRKLFYDQLRTPNLTYEEGEFKNIKQHEAFWAPIISSIGLEWETDNHFRSFQLMKSKHIAVVVPRHYIDLPNKIFRGIVSCKAVFVIAILLAILFSVALWIIEHRHNEHFPKSFIRGTGTGLWWSCVSMTTVGYGDIVPRSPIGRFIALWWLFIGVMVGCVMTATMTNIVSGIGDFGIYGKTVAVLENSYESKVASMDYQANIVPVQSYEKALELVLRNEVYAALLNADIAAWYQDEIQSLHIIEKIPANLYIKCLISTNVSIEIKNAFRCMFNQKEEIYTPSEEQFQKYCHTETLHVGSILELCRTDMFIQVLIGSVCLVFTIGVFYDLYNYLFPQKQYQKYSSSNSNNGKNCREQLLLEKKNAHKILA